MENQWISVYEYDLYARSNTNGVCQTGSARKASYDTSIDTEGHRNIES